MSDEFACTDCDDEGYIKIVNDDGDVIGVQRCDCYDIDIENEKDKEAEDG